MYIFRTPSENLAKTAVITETNSYSYQNLEDFSNKLAAKIASRSFVFHLCENTFGSLLGYYTFMKNHVVSLMIESKGDKELLYRLIDIYKPEFLWLPVDQLENFNPIEKIFEEHNYALIRINNQSPRINEDLALLLGTSGSTGSPKLVKLTHNNLEANALSIKEYLNIDENERPITALPMSYSFGISILNIHLLAGATILLSNRSLVEREFWSFLKEQKATSLSGVPYSFEMLKRLRFFKMELPHLKTLTQAGGKLHDELNLEFSKWSHEVKKDFFVMYGQTEATARMSYLPPKYNVQKCGSMGIAIPGGIFSIVDENRKEILDDEVAGELVYNGANVSMGYALNVEDLAKDDENKGILYTGDIAKRDVGGFYYIVGRMKRFIKLFGSRINLDEVERLIKTKNPDCACVGNDNELHIFMVNENAKEDIIDFVSGKIGIYPSVIKVYGIDAIPKNDSGKTIYSKLPKEK
jgi:long-chain acyl-CoA synthetase